MTALLLAASLISSGTDAPQDKGRELVFQGTFMEGCSCANSCAFESTGAITGCQALGVYSARSGSFGGRDLAGLRFAFVAAPNDALYIYIDARNNRQRDAAEKLTRILFAQGFGTLKAIKDANITLEGKYGTYHFMINGGNVVDMTIEPLFGGDGKGLIELRNVFGDPYDTLFQARTVSARFVDGTVKLDLRGTSAFFLEDIKIRKHI